LASESKKINARLSKLQTMLNEHLESGTPDLPTGETLRSLVIEHDKLLEWSELTEQQAEYKVDEHVREACTYSPGIMFPSVLPPNNSPRRSGFPNIGLSCYISAVCVLLFRTDLLDRFFRSIDTCDFSEMTTVHERLTIKLWFVFCAQIRTGHPVNKQHVRQWIYCCECVDPYIGIGLYTPGNNGDEFSRCFTLVNELLVKLHLVCKPDVDPDWYMSRYSIRVNDTSGKLICNSACQYAQVYRTDVKITDVLAHGMNLQKCLERVVVNDHRHFQPGSKVATQRSIDFSFVVEPPAYLHINIQRETYDETMVQYQNRAKNSKGGIEMKQRTDDRSFVVPHLLTLNHYDVFELMRVNCGSLLDENSDGDFGFIIGQDRVPSSPRVACYRVVGACWYDTKIQHWFSTLNNERGSTITKYNDNHKPIPFNGKGLVSFLVYERTDQNIEKIPTSVIVAQKSTISDVPDNQPCKSGVRFNYVCDNGNEQASNDMSAESSVSTAGVSADKSYVVGGTSTSFSTSTSADGISSTDTSMTSVKKLVVPDKPPSSSGSLINNKSSSSTDSMGAERRDADENADDDQNVCSSAHDDHIMVKNEARIQWRNQDIQKQWESLIIKEEETYISMSMLFSTCPECKLFLGRSGILVSAIDEVRSGVYVDIESISSIESRFHPLFYCSCSRIQYVPKSQIRHRNPREFDVINNISIVYTMCASLLSKMSGVYNVCAVCSRFVTQQVGEYTRFVQISECDGMEILISYAPVGAHYIRCRFICTCKYEDLSDDDDNEVEEDKSDKSEEQTLQAESNQVRGYVHDNDQNKESDHEENDDDARSSPLTASIVSAKQSSSSVLARGHNDEGNHTETNGKTESEDHSVVEHDHPACNPSAADDRSLPSTVSIVSAYADCPVQHYRPLCRPSDDTNDKSEGDDHPVKADAWSSPSTVESNDEPAHDDHPVTADVSVPSNRYVQPDCPAGHCGSADIRPAHNSEGGGTSIENEENNSSFEDDSDTYIDTDGYESDNILAESQYYGRDNNQVAGNVTIMDFLDDDEYATLHSLRAVGMLP
jgi:hypothetical protein